MGRLICNNRHAGRACAPLLAAFIVLTLLAGHVRANERYETWQADKPYTLAGYGTHNYGGGGTLDIDYFLGSGLNTAHDLHCGYNSARAMVEVGDLPVIYFVYIDRQPDLEGFIADFEKARQHYKNIIALQLGDEVKSAQGEAGLKHMRLIRDWVVNHPDPAVRNLLLITCTPAGQNMGSTESIRGYMNETVDKMRPDAVLAQIYSLDGRRYYSSLQWFADWSRKRDVAMWVVGKTWASDKRSLPSESELRMQKFTNLAYGVRGMSDFIWTAGADPTVRDGGYWNIDGRDNPTTLYQNVAPVNREVSTIAKSIVRLRPVRAYHLDSADDEGPGETAIHHWADSDADLPARIRRSFRLVNVTGTRNRNRLLVGFFRDKAGEEYFMVVNKDAGPATGAELTTRVTLSFHPSVKGIRRLRRDTGTLETMAVDEHYEFDLPGGTGDLFKFDTGSAFAGVEPLILPKVVNTRPGSGILGRVAKNRIVLAFDRPAGAVEAEIHRLDDEGEAIGPDLSPFFTRTVADNNRTLIFEETGSVFANDTRYRVTLYGADARPVVVRTVRGDVNGDGQVTKQDLALATTATGAADADAPADLDGNGTVDQSDLQIISQVITPVKFSWAESFEQYPVGPLPGKGGWLETETLPGSGISKAWAAPPVEITDDLAALDGPRKITGGDHAVGIAYRGAEIRFHDGSGFGDVGQLRCGFTARLGTAGFQDFGFSLFNSQDAAATKGSFTAQVEQNTLFLRGIGRGVSIAAGAKQHEVNAKQGGAAKGIAFEFLLDFDANTITSEWHDLNSGGRGGPHTLHYRGRFIGLDSISLFIVGKGTQADNVWVRNY